MIKDIVIENIINTISVSIVDILKKDVIKFSDKSTKTDLMNYIGNISKEFNTYLLQNLKNKNFDDLSLANKKIPNKYSEERDNLEEELSDEDGNYPKNDNEIKEILISKKYEEMFKAFESSEEVKIYSNDLGISYWMSLKNKCINFHLVYNKDTVPNYITSHVKNYMNILKDFLNKEYFDFEAILTENEVRLEVPYRDEISVKTLFQGEDKNEQVNYSKKFGYLRDEGNKKKIIL